MSPPGTGAAAPTIRLPLWRLAAFAAPSAPLLGLSIPTLIYLGPHFNESLGIPLTAVSAIFLLARIADIVVDPMIGGWQDRTQVSFGRRRFWMLMSLVPLMAFVWIAYLGLAPGVSHWIAGLVILGLYASYASMMIAHLSWAGELQPDYHGRTQTLGAVQIAGMIGYVAMLVVPAIVVGLKLGGPSDAVRAMGLLALLAAPVATLVCIYFVREAPSPPKPHYGFADGLKAIRSNPALRRVLIPDFLIGVQYGVTAALFVFLFRYYLEFRTQAEPLLLIYFCAGLLGIPLWTWLGRKLGKHRALQWGCVHAAIMLGALPFLPKGEFWFAAVAIAFAGISQSTGTMLLRSMMADVVDEEEARTGANRSGLFFGLLLTTSKIGLAMGPLCYVVLDMVGFDAALGSENSPGAMTALVALFVGAPLTLSLIAALALFGYPLDETRMRALAARNVAPPTGSTAGSTGP